MLRFYDCDNNDITEEFDCPTEFCTNPACLGEPWCSAWGICRGETLPEMATEDLDELFLELSQQLDSSPTLPELCPTPIELVQSSSTPSSSSSSSATKSHVKSEKLIPSDTSSAPTKGRLLAHDKSDEVKFSSEFSSSSALTKGRQFAHVKSNQEVELARATGIPSRTPSIALACGMYGPNTEKARQVIKFSNSRQLSIEEMQHWLCRFILEVNYKL